MEKIKIDMDAPANVDELAEKINEIVEWINETAIEKRVDRLEGIEN